MNNKKIFIVLFAILYVCVAFVSTFHAIAFFGLANLAWIAVMLAITFEIGQAAVLFSILTGEPGKRKTLPWILMSVLTLVQVLGNVYSSYKYLITNSADLLRFFKEPIFVWMDLPDAQCTVILTYIIGAILPIVSLLMTSMVTNFIGEKPVENVESPNVETPNVETPTADVQQNEMFNISEQEENVEQTTEEPINVDEVASEPAVETPIERESHFVNLNK